MLATSRTAIRFFTAAFIANGILTKETRSRTFRFAPPISIEEELIGEIVTKARAALSSVC